MKSIFKKFIRKFKKRSKNALQNRLENCRSLVPYHTQNTTSSTIKLIAIYPNGKIIFLENIVSSNKIFAIKDMIIEKGLSENYLQYYALTNSKLNLKYNLIAVKNPKRLIPYLTVEDYKLCHNDEIYLAPIIKVVKTKEKRNEKIPTNRDILKATLSLPKKRLVKPNDFQYGRYMWVDFSRRLVVLTLRLSAYIIAKAPFADHFIGSLKRHINFQRKVAHGAAEDLMAMGFSYSKVIFSLQHSGNNFNQALNWLRSNETSSTTSLNVNCYVEPSLLSLTQKKCVSAKVAALLEIIKYFNKYTEEPINFEMEQLRDTGVAETDISNAFMAVGNDVDLVCEWIFGDRAKAVEGFEQGFALDSNIANKLLADVQYQQYLSNPAFFLSNLAYINESKANAHWLQYTPNYLDRMTYYFYNVKEICPIYKIIPLNYNH